MQILRASEDYLEAMLMMQQEHGYIRSIDIADKLGVTKPSVTYATKRLRENGYITMDKDGLITLTEQGMAIAASMLDRHHTLTRFLMALGVDEETAESDACRLEHDLSQTSFDAICRHYLYWNQCARFMDGFKIDQRHAIAAQLVEDFKADGIIYENMKFCEFWSYEKVLANHIFTNEKHIPCCTIEKEYSLGAVGQLRTRFQAFIESLEIKSIQGGK